MKSIIDFLQEKNLKKTPLRKAVIEIFLEKKAPLTINDLKDFLKQKKFSPHHTSLYRQIESLTEKNILQSIILKNSTAYYELQQHHHHHFICENCKFISCIKDDSLESHIHSLEKTLEKKGFSIFSHQFSFHGKCKTCLS